MSNLKYKISTLTLGGQWLKPLLFFCGFGTVLLIYYVIAKITVANIPGILTSWNYVMSVLLEPLISINEKINNMFLSMLLLIIVSYAGVYLVFKFVTNTKTLLNLFSLTMLLLLLMKILKAKI